MIPKSYVSPLSYNDKRIQTKNILLSRKNYKKGIYTSRKKVHYPHKDSPYILRAKRQFQIDSLKPSPLLAKKTVCPLFVLNGIVRKGKGAYYSSGSRPNQTPESWAYARLASALTGGPASKVDAHLLRHCLNYKNTTTPIYA